MWDQVNFVIKTIPVILLVKKQDVTVVVTKTTPVILLGKKRQLNKKIKFIVNAKTKDLTKLPLALKNK